LPLHKFFRKNSELSKEFAAPFAVKLVLCLGLVEITQILAQFLKNTNYHPLRKQKRLIMKIQKQRELIIEFERVQLVRKKAKTQLVFCRSCGREVDFVSLREASSLFGTPAENLLHFVKINRSHFETGASGEIYICLVSFLGAMQTKTNLSRIKLIGG